MNDNSKRTKIPRDVNVETYRRLENKIVNLAKTIWNSDPKTFIDWATLTFQASLNEGDAPKRHEEALLLAYRALVDEEEFKKAEDARLANETQEVWKYQFDLTPEETIRELEVPKGAKILTVKENILPWRLSINIWMLVNPEAEKTPRQFQIVGTGETVPKDATYLGTTFFDKIVFHVWEIHKP